MSKLRLFCGVVALLAFGTSSPMALAQETLKVAAGQRGNWDTTIAEVGQRGGIFKKHGLTLEILYTQGGGETQQAVISGSVDIGVAPGIMGVLSAYSKGAPVRIIGAETTGASDLYWYVPAGSPIKSLKDSEGKTIAYSTVGSSTHGIVTALMKQYDLKAKPTATGGPAPTLTQVMSNQIDIGWSAPPFGLKEIQEGKIRIIARGSDVPSLKGQTVRLVIVNADALKQKHDAIMRFVKGWRETVEWMYSDPEAVKLYAEKIHSTEDLIKKSITDFQPKETLQSDRYADMDGIIRDAVKLKFLDQPLSKEQLTEFFQLPPK
jgi:NitT/TauT family transport system substrate-binding protein